ncbi:WG repeat-containing protein [Phaeovibrio sulfidiphilus]|uniref:WG repeat-containing protein n=1 Tax=Phaeovibrio sulfidiphilus TaxID=1220600 RepID=A0A8J6YXY4_9PROT|nr:WG repeat-containing protein [Phaeovibrio sulfidiphilus]MBE1237722.1 WG repeat-containing protein [Phaeovibrio sulfidiphilus]
MSRMVVTLAVLSATLAVVSGLVYAGLRVARPDPKAVFSAVLFPVSTQDPISAYLLDSRGIGYARVDGTLVIAPVFAEAGFFDSEGYALVRYRGRWGYIAPDGSFLINPVFLEASGFDCTGRARVTLEDGQSILVDRTGTPVEPSPQTCPPENAATPVRAGRLYGFRNPDGTRLLAPTFCLATPFHPNGLALVENCDGKPFYINRKGETVLDRNLGPGAPAGRQDSARPDWRPVLRPDPG